MSRSDISPGQTPAGRLDDEQLVLHAVAAAKPGRLWVEVVSPRPVPDVRARRLAMYHRPGEVDGLEMRFRRRIDGVLVSPSAPCAPASTADIDDAIATYMSTRVEELDFEHWADTDDDRDFGELVHWWELLDDPDNASPEKIAGAKAEAAISNGVPPRRSTSPQPSGVDRSPAAPSAPGRHGRRIDRDDVAVRVDPDRTRSSRALTGDRPGRPDRDNVLARVDLDTLLDALSGQATAVVAGTARTVTIPMNTPSVTTHVTHDGVQRWRCWSGGHGGTAIDAVMAAHRVDAGGAIRWLAEHCTNLPILDRPPPAPPAPLGHPDPEVGVYVERAARLLWTAAGRPQRAWLAGRGLGDDVLRANRVGADPGRRYLPRPEGLPGGWPAVVYPSLTPSGEVAYLQARYLDPPAHRSKYDNPAARLAANPRLAWTVPVGPPRPGLLVVCEGTADALVAAQAGFRSVGVLGAAYPDGRIAAGIAAARHESAGLADTRVVVCFDADPAGRSGAARLVDLLRARDIPAVTVTPPDGLDVTSWATTDAAWHATLAPSAVRPVVARPPGPMVAGPQIGLAFGGIG